MTLTVNKDEFTCEAPIKALAHLALTEKKCRVRTSTKTLLRIFQASCKEAHAQNKD